MVLYRLGVKFMRMTLNIDDELLMEAQRITGLAEILRWSERAYGH
jgi:hypothetical protein